MEGARPGTFVKICGITRLDDARDAVMAGATAVGFVFSSGPRRVGAEQVEGILGQIHPSVRRIGVFADASVEEVLSVVHRSGLDGVQLQGGEPPEMIEELRGRDPSLLLAKALRVQSRDDLGNIGDWPADVIFLDTKDPLDPARSHGSIPVEWLDSFDLDRVVVSGGLTPSNVSTVVSRLRPWGVDVSSGVEESPGRKDPTKLRSFLKEVRKAEGISRHPCRA